MDPKQRIHELTAILQDANYRYYVLDDPKLQFSQETVVFKILELWVIQHIITVIGLFQNCGQFLNSHFRVHRYLRSVNM